MSTFQLTIVTPDGEFYRGPAESLTVRAASGELTLLAHHIDFAAALGMGEARVTIDGQKRSACCIGGMLAMTKNEARLIATTFEWAGDIDLDRARDALARAEAALQSDSLSAEERKLREAARRRAQVRISVAENHK